METLPVSETTFVGIQGEGIRTGLKTIFLRLSGCNFAIEGHPCKYCDTPYAWKVNKKMFGLDVILSNLKLLSNRYRTKELCLTGGEPLYHPVQDLVHDCSKYFNLSVETNGSYPIWRMDGMWSLDIKCPSSGNDKYNVYQNLPCMTYKDQVKFIIQDKEDFDFAKDVVRSYIVLTNVIFQPSWKVLPLKTLIEWVIDDQDIGNVRVMTQLHKVAYPRRKRGV